MTGEIDLDVLLATMKARLADGIYVFASCADNSWPQNVKPFAMVREKQGTTLILTQEEARKADIEATFPSRMITLDVHSSLEAVGFISTISTALAEADMGVNPIAGYYHDHLFVPDGREIEALAILERLSQAAELRRATAKAS